MLLPSLDDSPDVGDGKYDIYAFAATGELTLLAHDWAGRLGVRLRCARDRRVPRDRHRGLGRPRPEPDTSALMVAGLALGAWVRRKRAERRST